VRQGEIGAILASSPFESACADLIALAKAAWRSGQHHLRLASRSAGMIFELSAARRPNQTIDSTAFARDADCA